MRTQCNPESMLFARLDRRDLVADFGGGAITSDAGALLLGATDKAIKAGRPVSPPALPDGRTAGRVVHDVRTLVGQRVFGIALGYEDLKRPNDDLRRESGARACFSARLEARRARVRAAGRQEHAEPAGARPGRRQPLPQDRPMIPEAMRAAVRRPVPGCPCQGAGAHSRSIWTPRTIRSTATRKAASSTASTTRLLLPAALTCSAASIYWRPKLRRSNIECQRGRDRENRPHRHTHPRALAKGAHPAARRQRLRPRGADGLVRGQQGRYLFGLARNSRLGEQIHVELAWAEDGTAERTGKTGPPVRRGTVPLGHPRQLEQAPAGRAKGE